MPEQAQSGRLQDSHAVLPIVDTHQHLWDLDRFELPWLREGPPVLRRSFVTRDYLRATEGLNIVKAVYMEVDVAPHQQRDEAEHVLRMARSDDHPTAAAVIAGRPAEESFPTSIAPFADKPLVCGVRQVLHVRGTGPGLCLESQFVASMRLLGELDLSFDLCMRPAELCDAVALVTQCPDTRFILDHCGNADPKAFLPAGLRGGARPDHDADQWRRDLAELGHCENVICKISGIVARAPTPTWTAQHLAPIVNHCLEAFGPERVVFGSDWPVCRVGATLRQWVDALKEVISERPVDLRRKLLHDNAVRLYRLG